MEKSYFAVLGVTSCASTDEIRSAYRRLVKAYHPDRFKGGSAPFRQIQEAYSILGNAHKRYDYEQSLKQSPTKRISCQTTFPDPEPLVPERGPTFIGEISPARSFQTYTLSSDEIFGWFWNNSFRMNWPKFAQVKNLTLEVPLTRDQAVRGGNAEVMVPARPICPTCRGHGAIGFNECLRCSGEGVISGEVPVSVSFPPGVAGDHPVMIPLERYGIHNFHLTVLFRPI